MLTQQQFNELAALGYSHIPVAKTLLADLETPLSIYSKVRTANTSSYLFESVQGGERWGRFSMIGVGSVETVAFTAHTVTHTTALGASTRNCADPLSAIRALQAEVKYPSQAHIEAYNLPAYTGGWVGYFGYETVYYLEPKLAQLPRKANSIGLPDIWLMCSSEVIVLDNLKGTLSIVVLSNANDNNAYQQALARIDSLEQQIQSAKPPAAQACSSGAFTSNIGQNTFEEAVAQVQNYIKAGDVMQVVPSQRMSASFAGDALVVYRAIRHINPSPYLFYVEGMHANNGHSEPFALIGSSPEILSRMENGTVTVRPIAGTRPRGATPAQDLALEAELLADEKEIAEHLMLIDLGRNDVARVSEIGTVQVTETMQIERYSHVMHIVSNVQGKVRSDVDALAMFAATFPAGTLTGAPKIRAMEIIHQLEPTARGVFGGAVGYIGWNGQMDTAIAIRTAVAHRQQIHIQAGAGVVADSVASSEWNETLIKAKAMMRAVELSTTGLKIG